MRNDNPSNVTGEQLVAEVRRLASEDPSFIYPVAATPPKDKPNCLYNPDKHQPGCIFGQALINLGDPVPVKDDRGNIGTQVWIKKIEATKAQIRWMMWAQQAQDQRMTWGDAIAYADAQAEAYEQELKEVRG